MKAAVCCIMKGKARRGNGVEMDQHIINGGTPVGLLKRKKSGGRQKGTPNKRTVERQEARAAIRASGKTPMAFFADILGNEQALLDLRFAAARELAPFVHPKLSSIEARTGGM